jgi:hypothetical protein
MGARYYSPQFSIFTSVDAMRAYRSWVTPYNYVQNNPVMRQDPTGMLDVGPGEKPNETGPKGTYTIKQGDTFWDLGNLWGLEHGTLKDLNPDLDPRKLNLSILMILAD